MMVLKKYLIYALHSYKKKNQERMSIYWNFLS